METVENLVAMRSRNPALERLWNGENIDRVELLWEETLALEGRAAFYDRAGALKDLMQNHMLQLLALVATEPPANDRELGARRLDTLRSARVVGDNRRARYTDGTLADGREVPSYADAEGVDPARCTETFAEIVLELDSPRWTARGSCCARARRSPSSASSSCFASRGEASSRSASTGRRTWFCACAVPETRRSRCSPPNGPIAPRLRPRPPGHPGRHERILRRP